MKWRLHDTYEQVFGLVDAMTRALKGVQWTDAEHGPLNDQMMRLAERDGGWLCFYCETPLAHCDGSGTGWVCVARVSGFPDQLAWMVLEGFERPHVEHIIPRSKGGSNRRINLSLACPGCNFRKRTQMPLDFLA